MRPLDELVHDDTIPEVISELEEMAHPAGFFSTGAILILKNILQPATPGSAKQILDFEARFAIPGGVSDRWSSDFKASGFLKTLGTLIRDSWLWFIGRDAENFRDRCDLDLWRRIVPVIAEGFGPLADPLMNTINEAIINYAEYSFKRWSILRRIHIHVFKTDAELAYAIIRPSGTRLRSFDPLELKTRPTGERTLKKRGWGHTLLMERALFLSFDQAKKRRGMMIIVGQKPARQSGA